LHQQAQPANSAGLFSFLYRPGGRRWPPFHFYSLQRMRPLLSFSLLSSALLSASLLRSPAACAQVIAPAATSATHGYDFLTMSTAEGTKGLSYILFAPAFQGKNELPLEAINVIGVEKYKEHIRQNEQLINEQLSALTVAGWELVSVQTETLLTNGRCYLFRKAKN